MFKFLGNYNLFHGRAGVLGRRTGSPARYRLHRSAELAGPEGEEGVVSHIGFGGPVVKIELERSDKNRVDVELPAQTYHELDLKRGEKIWFAARCAHSRLFGRICLSARRGQERISPSLVDLKYHSTFSLDLLFDIMRTGPSMRKVRSMAFEIAPSASADRKSFARVTPVRVAARRGFPAGLAWCCVTAYNAQPLDAPGERTADLLRR